jgi:FkbM family methyltransferase
VAVDKSLVQNTSVIKQAVYKALDAVTLGRGVARSIGGERIRFPAKWSRYYEAEYEPETFRFFREHVKSGDTVLDIGGHIGLFAVVTARLVGADGKVFSFEPTPFTRNVLQEVVDLNNCSDRVEVRPEAVSSQSGETTFFDTGNEISNANSLVRTERSKVEIRVPLTTVDDFVNGRSLSVNCLKIDVEGAELDLLSGARETFLRQRPVARLGLHPAFIAQNNQSLSDIWQMLGEYKMRVEFEGALAEKEWFCSQTDLFDVNLLPS